MKQITYNNISTHYYITPDGKCFNSKTGKYLKGQVTQTGAYLSYMITLPDGKKKRFFAHRLVALNYIPNPDNKPAVNHIDGNKMNNTIDNLEWCTHEENQQHALKLELRKFNHVFCFNKEKILVAEYKNISEAAYATGLSKSTIARELKKNPKSLSGGFYWSLTKNNFDTIVYSKTNKAKQVYQYDLKGKFITSYPSTGIAAKAIHGVHSHIGECCRGSLKQYKGFIWRYAEDIVSPINEN